MSCCQGSLESNEMVTEAGWFGSAVEMRGLPRSDFSVDGAELRGQGWFSCCAFNRLVAKIERTNRIMFKNCKSIAGTALSLRY
jgi:hypothetical protein